MKPDAVGQDSKDEVFPVFREAASSSEILSDSNAPSGQTLTAAAYPSLGTSTRTGTQYPPMGTDTTPEYLTVGTNTPLRSFANDSTNTATVADVACSTVDWPYEMPRKYSTTHDDDRCSIITIDSHSVATNTESISFNSRQLTRTNHETGTSSDTRNAERLQFVGGMPTNIPNGETLATYQSTRLDGAEIVPELVDYDLDDSGHVINRKQVSEMSQRLCTSCRRPMDEQHASEAKVSVGNSPVGFTDFTHDEYVSGKQDRTADGRNFQEFPAYGKTDVVPESVAVMCQDQAVGSNHTFPVVECGVGHGMVWTDSRGTGEGTVWTADAETWTPTVAVIDRAIGTRSVRLVHKNEATDSQETTDVATSPAEDITSAYRGLLAATLPRVITVSRGTATPPAPSTADRQTVTEHRKLVDCGTSPAVDVTAAYRGRLGSVLSESSRVTVSRGTLAVLPRTPCIDKDTITVCTMVDRASSPIKVDSSACFYKYNFIHHS